MATGCPSQPPSVQILNGNISVENDFVRAIPHIGPVMEKNLQDNGLFTILDVIELFSNTPPYSAKSIETRLANMLPSPNRNGCVRKRNHGNYQTSDVNQCAFNNILELLRFAHRYRGQHGIPVGTNIPLARRVPMRRRGIAVGIQARSVRFCGCKRTEAECNNRNLRCQWHSASEAGLTRGVCTPNVRRRSNSGFRGKSEPWEMNTRNPQASQFSLFGTRDGSEHTVIDGDIYVNRWRVPGRVRRRRRRRGGRLLSAGKKLKRRILQSEQRNGSKNMELRRKFNHLMMN